MKLIIISSVLVIFSIGLYLVPDASAEYYYHDRVSSIQPSFSIEYPDGWNVDVETKFLSQNGYEYYPTLSVSFLDGNEYGSTWSLWKNMIIVAYYPNVGEKFSDSEERRIQIEDYRYTCNAVTLAVDGYTCENFEVFHSIPSSYTIEGYPIITTVFKETNYYPDLGTKDMVTTASSIYVGTHMWDIVTTSDLKEFDKTKSVLFDVIDSFRHPASPVAQAEAIPSTSTPDSNEGGGCLIATAAFGSEMAPQVQFLREIRDNTVLQTQAGTSFMTGFNQFYYSFSPAVADYERENPMFKEAVKLTLTPLLTSLAILNYVDIDTEQEMLGYGIGVILLNIGMYFVAPAIVIISLKKRFKF